MVLCIPSACRLYIEVGAPNSTSPTFPLLASSRSARRLVASGPTSPSSSSRPLLAHLDLIPQELLVFPLLFLLSVYLSSPIQRVQLNTVPGRGAFTSPNLSNGSLRLCNPLSSNPSLQVPSSRSLLDRLAIRELCLSRYWRWRQHYWSHGHPRLGLPCCPLATTVMVR